MGSVCMRCACMCARTGGAVNTRVRRCARDDEDRTVRANLLQFPL